MTSTEEPGPLAPLFAQVRKSRPIVVDEQCFMCEHDFCKCLAEQAEFDAALSSIERHVQEAVALLDECLNDGDRAWEPEELVQRMEDVRDALMPDALGASPGAPSGEEEK